MFFISDQQVKLGVFFNFNADIVKALDRSITCKEVLRTGTKGDNLKTGQTEYGSCDRNEVSDHISDFLSGADRILRNMSADLAHTEVVRAVEHTAVSVATSINQVFAGFLSGSSVHDRAVKTLCNQGFRGFRAEVAEEYAQSITSGFLNLIDCLQHIQFILNSSLCLVDFQALCGACSCDSSAAAFRERDDKAVTADCNQTEFDDRNILHNKSSFLL